MPQALERLKAAGVHMAVLTNKADQMAAPVVNGYYPDVFPMVQGAVKGFPTKPDPTLLHRLMSRMGATPLTPSLWGTATWTSARRKTAA